MEIPLSEKYRPSSFSEVIGVKDLDKLKVMVQTPSSLPNLLFVGPPGVGKTTVAKIIINSLSPIDCLRINGSDTTGVDIIRDKVHAFMTSMSSISGKPKLIWIEEFDYMSPNAFAALRAMIEQYIKNARFICTANYITKIPDPILSRFTTIEFKKPTNEEIAILIKCICDKENIKIDDYSIVELVSLSHGDIRTTINNLQSLSSTVNKNISVVEICELNSNVDLIYDLIMSSKWIDIRYSVPKMNIDYRATLVKLDEKLCSSCNSLSIKAELNEIISDGLADIETSFDEDICFSAICSRLMRKLGKL